MNSCPARPVWCVYESHNIYKADNTECCGVADADGRDEFGGQVHWGAAVQRSGAAMCGGARELGWAARRGHTSAHGW